MRRILPLILLLATGLAGAPALASTSTDFYASLLKRGAADVEAGRFETAITPLRLAAFGLVDSIEPYETALAYLAIALDKTGESVRAHEVLQRILAAERIERRFATLPLPDSIRAQFDALARRALSPAEVAALSAPENPRATPSPRPAAPVASGPADTNPAVANPKPAAAKSAPAKPGPAVTQPATVKQKPQPRGVPVTDVSSRLASAERALGSGNLREARRIYRELLATQDLDHGVRIRVVEGLYRSRDFPSTLAAFEKVESLRAGEEAYRYYIAVALYETGQFARARKELAAALPYIELTPDVVRYRRKIEEAQ